MEMKTPQEEEYVEMAAQAEDMTVTAGEPEVENEPILQEQDHEAQAQQAPAQEEEDEEAQDQAVPDQETQDQSQTDSEAALVPNQSDTPAPKPAPDKHRLPHLPQNTPFVTIDEKAGVQTNVDKARNDLLDMMESMKNGRILTDNVQGVERRESGEALAVVYHGTFKIIIPAAQMIDPPDELYGHSVESLMAYMLTKRLGSQIDYIIKGIDPDSGIAVASRKDAMAVKRRRYYYPDHSGKTILYEGCLAEARVVTVLPTRVYVELFGAEAALRFKEMSYEKVHDANTLFAVGDRVLTKILTIRQSGKSDVTITASIRQAQENPVAKIIQRYTAGSYYSGVVSQVDTIGVFVHLDGGGECLCGFPQRGRPVPGARATVRLRDIDVQQCRMWGDIQFWGMA